MQVVAVSDLHGHLPPIPPCDLLLIAGDVCPSRDHDLQFQKQWLYGSFTAWLLTVPAEKIIGVWGNHDLVAEKEEIDLPWTVLTDQMTEYQGLRIYGLPWTREFFDWAFMLPEVELDKKYEAIPDCDIIVSHGPPFSCGDYVPRSRENVGSRAFAKRISEIQPRLAVFGHIHEGREHSVYHDMHVANVTLVDEHYRPAHKPMEFTL